MKKQILDVVFYQLKLAFERRNFEIMIPEQDHGCSFFAYNKKREKIPIFIVTDFSIGEMVKIRIYNPHGLNANKKREILQKQGDFFSLNADNELEKTIPVDLGAYPNIDDIANNFTRAYSFIVSE